MALHVYLTILDAHQARLIRCHAINSRSEADKHLLTVVFEPIYLTWLSLQVLLQERRLDL